MNNNVDLNENENNTNFNPPNPDIDFNKIFASLPAMVDNVTKNTTVSPNKISESNELTEMLSLIFTNENGENICDILTKINNNLKNIYNQKKNNDENTKK